MADLGAVGENGLLTKRTSFGQASPWDNNGAEQGLLTKRTGLYLDLAWDNNGGQQGLLTKRTNEFPPQPPPAPPTPPPPSVSVLKYASCPQKIDCECPELPLENLSSEDLDVPVFCATVTVQEDAQLGICGPEFSCTRFACSEESQQDAYLKALKLTQECVYGGWGTQTCPPPNDPEPGCPPICSPPPCPPCDPNCPPNCPPPPPFVAIYPNDAQSCTIECADGGTFYWTVPHGTVTALSQIQADFLAHSLACKLAKQNKICFVTTELEDGCEDEQYLQQIKALGGRPFVSPFVSQNTVFTPDECISLTLPNGTIVPYHYEIISGSLPPGVELDCFGWLRGTATTAGLYIFTVQINDANGITQSKEFSVLIEDCDPGNYGSVTPDIASNTVSYWNSADPIAAGTYRINYINGAWESPGNVWLVGDGVLAGPKGRGYYIVYNDGAAEIAFPVSGLYSSQAEAEAGTSGKEIEITHTGGRIGIYLHDLPYGDNSSGSPNPTFNMQET